MKKRTVELYDVIVAGKKRVEAEEVFQKKIEEYFHLDEHCSYRSSIFADGSIFVHKITAEDFIRLSMDERFRVDGKKKDIVNDGGEYKFYFTARLIPLNHECEAPVFTIFSEDYKDGTPEYEKLLALLGGKECDV